MLVPEKGLENFNEYLISKGFSKSTISSYLYHVKILNDYLKDKEMTPSVLEQFKKNQEKRFVPPTVRSMICGINNYLEFLGSPHRIEQITVPKQKAVAQKDFITCEEYSSILKSIKRMGNYRLYLIVESIAVAGLKLSELKFLTVEAVIKRNVTLPDDDEVYLSKHLCEDLLEYCKENNIFSGAILLTRGGKIPDKANVSREIKSACLNTGIDVKKISTKTLREFYFRNYESYKCEIVEMMDRELGGIAVKVNT